MGKRITQKNIERQKKKMSWILDRTLNKDMFFFGWKSNKEMGNLKQLTEAKQEVKWSSRIEKKGVKFQVCEVGVFSEEK